MSLTGQETAIRVPLEVHSVPLPAPKTTLQKLRDKVSEIFFPDDPLHQFKNKSLQTKLILGLQYLFPIFQWLPGYGFDLFRSDLVSGLTIASLAIPQVTIFLLPWCRKLGHGNWLHGPRYLTLPLELATLLGGRYILFSWFVFSFRVSTTSIGIVSKIVLKICLRNPFVIFFYTSK